MKIEKKYSCIIVEDEPIAMEIIEDYISKNKELQLVGKCSDAIYASSLLNMQKVDLMFLDLNLPIVKGFDLLKKIKNPPYVIVTTAYHEYAVEGYELNIVDYLMKPISYSRFLIALTKFKHLSDTSEAILEMADQDYIFINIRNKKIKILSQDIFYIESVREYIKIHTKQQTYTVKIPISRFEEKLDKSSFIRIHKSYIISKSKIEVMSANEIVVNGKNLPIGRTYKQYVGNYNI